MHPFTVLVLTLTVCFFSPFLDSLPQLFLKCLLPTCVFRIVHLTSAFFRPLQFNFRLLSFLFLPFRSSRFYLTAVFSMHPFHSHFQDFPVTWYLISHASLHGSLTRLYWWFLFVLPWFAPAAVPQVNPFWIASLGQILGFSFLSSTSALASHYLASVSSVPFLLVLPHSSSTSVRLNFHLGVFLLSSRPDFSCLSSRFLYLAFCLFSFALSCFSPTADLQVIPLCFRFRDFLLQVHFLSSVFHSLPATQSSVSSVPFLLVLPHSGSTSARLNFRLGVFLLSSRPDLSCLSSRFLYLAFCLFPFALPWLTPTAVDQVIP